MHFSGRGLTNKRLRSQTIIKNYFIEREDATTACERLTKIKPESLLDYLCKNMGDLPEPRCRMNNTQKSSNPLRIKEVPL